VVEKRRGRRGREEFEREAMTKIVLGVVAVERTELGWLSYRLRCLVSDVPRRRGRVWPGRR
jgi:hypothetical protein